MTDVVAALRAQLGDRVDTDPDLLERARADKSGHAAAGTPLAVVHAASVDDVQATMRIATATATPVVVRGAGTGLAGGSQRRRGRDRPVGARNDPHPGGPPRRPARRRRAGHPQRGPQCRPRRAGPVVGARPGQRDISTVGGNIATGAGGLLCAKYGVVRDAVLGVDLVLADGRLLRLGHRSVKGVTGLDLTSLVIGSEGTLGVVVAATLKLRRLVPGHTRTLTATFPDVRSAAAGAAAVTASGVQPAIMELMDAASLTAVHALLGLEQVTPGRAQLTVQTDGAAADAEAEAIAVTLAAAGGTVRLAADDAEAELLWRIRRSMHPAMETLGTTLIEDVSVPRSALPAMFDEIARVEREHGVRIPTVCHAGDGNLHPNFVFSGTEVPPEIWAAADDLFRAALRLGGTLTGEHGVGVLKRRWLRDELGDDQWELQRQITRVFDPAGILNPGKVFDR
ncbi:FAD-binding oxidoreductase [Microbacterium aurum]